jgi:succinoglycan biosynthesis transport protein ExoP
MTAGPLPMNASELISGQGCREAIEQLEAAFDIVILDGPPIMGLADAPIFATMVESVLFVTAANGVSRVAAKRALDRLPPARTQVLGAVLTKFDTKAESYGGYGYNESYGAYAYAYGASVPHQEASPQSASAQARSI